jgi:glycosyltransferase involved in cell wall biosynthesis
MLRVAIFTTLYPPATFGGYEVACERIARRLAARGHAVTVYCARAGDGDRGGVRVQEALRDYVAPRPAGQLDARLLYQWFDPHNLRALHQVLGSRDHDVGFVWNMACTSFSSLTAFARSRLPLVWEVSDLWLRAALGGPRAMAAQARRSEIVRAGLSLPARVMLRRRTGDRFIYVSDWLRRAHAGLLGPDEVVIPHGVDLEDFPVPGRTTDAAPMRLVYAGRLHPTKGAHFLLRALAATRAPMSVTVAGDGEPGYVSSLREAAAGAARPGLRIDFVGRVSAERMPALYRDHEVYVLPTVIDEAFSVGLLEAMAMRRRPGHGARPSGRRRAAARPARCRGPRHRRSRLPAGAARRSHRGRAGPVRRGSPRLSSSARVAQRWPRRGMASISA